MSNFPSIEEFDSGQVTATKLEDKDTDLLNSPQDDLFAREQAALGDDADFFQSGQGPSQGPSQGEAAFFDGPQGIPRAVQRSLLVDEDVQEFESSFPALPTNVGVLFVFVLMVEWIYRGFARGITTCKERGT